VLDHDPTPQGAPRSPAVTPSGMGHTLRSYRSGQRRTSKCVSETAIYALCIVMSRATPLETGTTWPRNRWISRVRPVSSDR
jgi:hypothetical protein